MVEIALALPLFILGVMIFVWLGMALNARTSLKYAMAEAMGLARQRAALKTSPGIEAVIAHRARTHNLLVHNVPASDADSYYRNHDIMNPLNIVPTESWRVYALVFTYEAMKKSLGEALRYPCLPDEPGGENCLACSFAEDYGTMGMRCSYQPSFLLLTPIFRLISLLSGGAVGPPIVFKQTAV